MRNTQFLNQAACAVVLDGVQVTDYSEGDAIRINDNGEGSTVEAGLDGATTTFSTDQSGTMELDLKGTSATLDQVNALFRAQKTEAARLFDVQIYTAAAEPIRCEGCSIASPGNITTGGKEGSPRTVVINVQKIIRQ